MSTISQLAVTMMEGIVVHLTSLNGQNVLTILHGLEMEYVMFISPNLNAIMMEEIAAANNFLLVMEDVMIRTILPLVVISMEVTVNLMDNVMSH